MSGRDVDDEARQLVDGRLRADEDLVVLHQTDPQFHHDMSALVFEVAALLEVTRARHPYSEVAAITTAYAEKRIQWSAKGARDMRRIREQLAARSRSRLLSEFT